MLRTQTASTARWFDAFLWYALRGFYMFLFAVLAYLILQAFTRLQRWSILAFLPAFAFAVFEQAMRIHRWPSINQVPLLLIDAVGIAIGLWIYVRLEVKRELQVGA